MDFLVKISFGFRCIYSLILYLGIAISLYHIAKNNNVDNPWIAFIPIAQYYIIGSICEEYVIFGFRIKNLKWTLIGLELLQFVLAIFGSPLYIPLRIVVNILIVLVLHKFFYLFSPQHAVLYAVLSLFGRLPLVIIMFIIKDYPMCMSAAAFRYPFADRPR